MPFLAVDSVIGSFEASGTIGLAPHFHNKSYVYQLWEQSQIPEKIVGLNFEDPLDSNQVSQITFGFMNEDEIEECNAVYNMDNCVNYFKNVGSNIWALMAKEVSLSLNQSSFDDVILQEEDRHGKMAIIDSSITTIQMPKSEYALFKQTVEQIDSSIREEKVGKESVLASSNSCE